MQRDSEGPRLDRSTEPNASKRRIRVFVLDDHELVRRGIRESFELEPDLVVVGEAEQVAGAVDALRASHPNVALLDVRLPDGDGVEICRRVTKELPDVRCMMLTASQDEDVLMDALLAGASGFFLKGSNVQDLKVAVRRLAFGESYIDPSVTTVLLDGMRSGGRNQELRALTERELDVLRHVAEGKTNAEIAREVHLAEKTVKNYVSSIMSKLGMRHRTELALHANRLFGRGG